MSFELTALAEERSRDNWIAADAALKIAEGVPLETIASEPLEALADLISFELQDRSVRNGHATVCRK